MFSCKSGMRGDRVLSSLLWSVRLNKNLKIEFIFQNSGLSKTLFLIPLLAFSSIQITLWSVRIAVITTDISRYIVIAGRAPANANITDRSVVTLIVLATFNFWHLDIATKAVVLDGDEFLIATLCRVQFAFVQICDSIGATDSCYFFSLTAHVHALTKTRCRVTNSSKWARSSSAFIFHELT